MFVDFYLILLHHKTLFRDVYKEKGRRGYSEKKKKALQEPEKGKSAKDVAAKYNLPKSSLRGRRMMKNL